MWIREYLIEFMLKNKLIRRFISIGFSGTKLNISTLKLLLFIYMAL